MLSSLQLHMFFRERVLYIEDDNELRENTSIFLNDIFLKVDEAEDGQIGLNMFRQNSYDIVITDLTMPNIDGISLIRIIKKESPTQAIVITSAHNESKVFLEAILLGVDGFILKPMNFTFFVSTLSKVSYNVVATKEKERREEELEENLKISRKKISELDKIIQESGEIDSLTKISNRKSFDKKLFEIQNETISSTAFMVDIDRFTNVNRVYGIGYGDTLLKIFASRLSNLSNKFPSLSVYRLESDKFIMLLQQSSKNLISALLSEINRVSAEPFILHGSASIHIKLLISIVERVEYEEKVISKLLKAMMEKKSHRQERVNYIFYDKGSPFLKQQEENLLWMHRIHSVIKNGDVYPIFQPIIDNNTLEVVKYESLMRIEYKGEVISPAKFIEPATILGLLPELTKILIDKTLQKMQTSSKAFSINISEEDIEENYLQDYIKEKLEEHQIESKRVTFEILENMTTDNRQVLEHLSIFKDIGVEIAIDDFGSESSNFSRLSSVQANLIKIDGQFIKDLDSNKLNMKIVKAIVFLAKEFDCKIVAEFVHNEEIFKIVRDLGIDYSQGYYFGAPCAEIEKEN